MCEECKKKKDTIDNLVVAVEMLLNDFVYLRDKCTSLGCNWTLASNDCFQYNFAKNALKGAKDHE